MSSHYCELLREMVFLELSKHQCYERKNKNYEVGVQCPGKTIQIRTTKITINALLQIGISVQQQH